MRGVFVLSEPVEDRRNGSLLPSRFFIIFFSGSDGWVVTISAKSVLVCAPLNLKVAILHFSYSFFYSFSS